MNKIDEVRKSK